MAQQTVEPPASRPTPRRRRRGVVFWVGVTLILVGVGLLAYVAWQFFGTNVVSHHKQKALIERTEEQWKRARVDAGATGETRGRTGGRPRGNDLGGAQALVRIPAFGKDYVVPVQKGVSEDVLAEGLGHFPQSVAPGQVGNYAIAGHRVTHGEPFRHLPQLHEGSRVVVETRDRTYTYRLTTDPKDLIVTFNDIWVVSPLPRNPRGGVQPAQRQGQRLITLTTCSELFHTDNRMIAFGHLVSSRAS